MKTIFLSIGFLLTFSYYSFAQEFPAKSAILKIIGDLNRKSAANGDNELGVNTDKQFRYIDAKFTSLPSAECIVIVPVLLGSSPLDMVIHCNYLPASFTG